MDDIYTILFCIAAIIFFILLYAVIRFVFIEKRSFTFEIINIPLGIFKFDKRDEYMKKKKNDELKMDEPVLKDHLNDICEDSISGSNASDELSEKEQEIDKPQDTENNKNDESAANIEVIAKDCPDSENQDKTSDEENEDKTSYQEKAISEEAISNIGEDCEEAELSNDEINYTYAEDINNEKLSLSEENEKENSDVDNNSKKIQESIVISDEFDDLLNKDDDIVYWTASGKAYHTSRMCRTLSRSKVIFDGTREDSGRYVECIHCKK